jgi:hypothetical protein
MRIPSIGETVVYDISDTEYVVVKLSESGEFWLTIINRENPGPAVESPFDNNSNVIFLNTIEKVKEYLLEKADEAHKVQFQPSK